MKQFFKTPVKVVYSQIPLSWHGELQAVSPLLAWYSGEVGKMQLWNCDLLALHSSEVSSWQGSYHDITISLYNEQDMPRSEQFNQPFFWGSLSFLQSYEEIEIFTGLLLFHFPSIDV